MAVYSGRKAFELYLQCYQLILWKQCYSLVSIKGFTPDLESVVRDLWALRLQVFKDRSGDVSDIDDESRVFSSQVEGTEGSDTENDVSSGLEQKRKEEKTLPNLIDTLSLCYLGTLLLRTPLSIGELYR